MKRKNNLLRYILVPLIAIASIAGTRPRYADEQKTEAQRTYVIKKGDSFWKIALNHGFDLEKLIQANREVDPKSLKPGQKIVLPYASKETIGNSGNYVSPEFSKGQFGETSNQNSRISNETKREDYYIINKGDIVSKLARNVWGISLETVSKHNPQLNLNKVKPGDKIVVPPRESRELGKIVSDSNSPSNQNKRISSKGLNILKNYEGFSPIPYPDAGGFSIGYGHFIKPGEKYRRVTLEEAEEILKKDLAQVEKAINDHVTAPLNQHQFDAIVCLSYNTGIGVLKKSALVYRLNKGDYQAAADKFRDWVISDGKTNKSLIKRRDSERKLFLEGDYK